SFITPLAPTLKSAGLTPNVVTDNAHNGQWLDEVAHQRIHGTTGVQPAVRLAQEQQLLLPLPTQSLRPQPAQVLRLGRVLPYESLQHTLSVYEQLL
ncbi:ISPsy4, transposase, partial [Pseudomonas syringae pv. philadelphi]